MAFQATIEFQDKDGFVVDDDDADGPLIVESGDSRTFTGYELVTTAAAVKVARTNAKVRASRQYLRSRIPTWNGDTSCARERRLRAAFSSRSSWIGISSHDQRPPAFSSLPFVRGDPQHAQGGRPR
jgi:hypothetical protein